jgi:hypothetical protein
VGPGGLRRHFSRRSHKPGAVTARRVLA